MTLDKLLPLRCCIFETTMLKRKNRSRKKKNSIDSVMFLKTKLSVLIEQNCYCVQVSGLQNVDGQKCLDKVMNFNS